MLELTCKLPLELISADEVIGLMKLIPSVKNALPSCTELLVTVLASGPAIKCLDVPPLSFSLKLVSACTAVASILPLPLIVPEAVMLLVIGLFN